MGGVFGNAANSVPESKGSCLMVSLTSGNPAWAGRGGCLSMAFVPAEMVARAVQKGLICAFGSKGWPLVEDELESQRNETTQTRVHSTTTKLRARRLGLFVASFGQWAASTDGSDGVKPTNSRRVT